MTTMNSLILTTPKKLCFIHCNTDYSGVKALRTSRYHAVNQFVSTLIFTQQNILTVIDLGIVLPPEDRVQVRQRINCGNDLHTVIFCIGIQFFQFGLGIASTAIAKIRVALNFIGILLSGSRALIARSFSDKR